MDNPSRDLWVFVETNQDGTARKVGLELLNPGRRLADQQGGKLVAVVLAEDTTLAVKAVLPLGADTVMTITGAPYRQFNTEVYTAALCYLLQKYQPQTFLLGATSNGRELAPRISSRLQTGLTADCTQLHLDESGLVAWTRPAFGGNIMAEILCPKHRPQMGTVRPGVFKLPAVTAKRGEVIAESFPFDLPLNKLQVVQVINEVSSLVDLEGAEIIVAGGRGVGSAQGFQVLRTFAETIGAEIGASRGAVDAGWIPHAHQVGQTGKSVSPRLYIACGISGAAQHLAGIGSAEIVLAINQDPNAMIFKIADYGIVGDLFEVLPLLAQELRSRLGSASSGNG